MRFNKGSSDKPYTFLLSVPNTLSSIVLALLLSLQTPITGRADGSDDALSMSVSAHDSTPVLLSSEQIAQVATHCRHEILQAHQQKALVPKDKMREYAITLGIAAEKCEAITRAFLELQKASQDYQIYQQNLQHAQLCAQGGGYSPPLDDASTGYTPSPPLSSADFATSLPSSRDIVTEPLPPEHKEPLPLR